MLQRNIIGVDCKNHNKHVNTWHNRRYNCECQWSFGKFEHFSDQIILMNSNSLDQINFPDRLLIFNSQKQQLCERC